MTGVQTCALPIYELKGEIVEFLKSKNKTVISFGDSLVDKYMLLNSDLGIYIIHDRIKSVYQYLSGKKNVKYISFNNELRLTNNCETSIKELQTIISKEW